MLIAAVVLARVLEPRPCPALPRSSTDRARIAWVAGASGLVGTSILRELEDDEHYTVVHVLARRAFAPSGRKQVVHVLPNMGDENALVALMSSVAGVGRSDIYIAIGTTIRAAGSAAAFRHVDLDTTLAVARAARRAGAARCALISSMGASAQSYFLHPRVKGQVEAGIRDLGFDAATVIARPAVLLGDRDALGQAARPLERVAAWLLQTPVGAWVPLDYRAIPARRVARAVVKALCAADASPEPRVMLSGELQCLGSE